MSTNKNVYQIFFQTNWWTRGNKSIIFTCHPHIFTTTVLSRIVKNKIFIYFGLISIKIKYNDNENKCWISYKFIWSPLNVFHYIGMIFVWKIFFFFVNCWTDRLVFIHFIQFCSNCRFQNVFVNIFHVVIVPIIVRKIVSFLTTVRPYIGDGIEGTQKNCTLSKNIT